MTLYVSQLATHPLKSAQPFLLDQSYVSLSGLAFDRQYMVVDENGLFVSGRKDPLLMQIEAIASENELILKSNKQAQSLNLSITNFSSEYISVEVWHTHILGQLTTTTADEWLSTHLNRPVRLIYFGPNSERFTSRRPDSPVAFADGYPFLLATEASLQELNRTCPQQNEMSRFRPNIVVSGSTPFAEDTWKTIRIGDVIFENVKPCERCIFTTRDPITTERSPLGEPLKTLAQFRRTNKGGVMFGINLIAKNEGTIQKGEPLDILEYQDPYPYADNRT